MTTIKLHIPDDIAEKVKSLTGNAEKFIIDLIRKELDKPKSQVYEYSLAGSGNATLMKDFAHKDLKGREDEY